MIRFVVILLLLLAVGIASAEAPGWDNHAFKTEAIPAADPQAKEVVTEVCGAASAPGRFEIPGSLRCAEVCPKGTGFKNEEFGWDGAAAQVFGK